LTISSVPAPLAAPRRARTGWRVGASATVGWRAAALAALSLALAGALLQSADPAHTSSASAPRSGRLGHGGLFSLPLSAQGPVSAALGAYSPAYRVSVRRGGGFTAANPGQRLSASFGAGGMRLGSGATRLGLSLRAVGYGGALTALAEVAPRASANRVRYVLPGLQEWYVNGPLGLEQGFTVSRAPARSVRGALTLVLALSGNVRATPAAGGQSVTLRRAGAPVLTYGGLSATDAHGRPLPSSLEVRGARLLLHVQARGARYPLRIDPFIHQGEKLNGSGLSGPYGYIGQSVALSADGNTALVGASADGTYTEYRGAAFVFTRSGSTWTQQGAKLTGGGESGGAWFGESVALSADGNTALIGGPSDNAAAGAAWVFTRSGSTWTQQGAKLTGGGELGAAQFGRSVALSADGNTALIGGYDDNEHDGAAWVFTRSGSTWTQQGAKLTGGGGQGFFGWSVALSGDGDTALIGEWGIGGGVGAAWVLTRSGSTWSKQGEALTAGPDSSYSWFGWSVALSADGDTALIGAPHADSYAGAGLVFTRSGSAWAAQGEALRGGEEVGEGELGYSAALSGDGDTALLGGRVDEDFHGAAWAFSRTGSSWAPAGGKLTGGSEGTNREEFGWSVALSSGGETALIGSPCDKACVGSASVFVTPPAPPEYGRCEKVGEGSGAYGQASCTSTGGKQDYEWEPGVQAGGFTLTAGSVVLETVGRSKITCSGETGSGTYAGQKHLGGLVLTLTGCESAHERCSSAGAGAGEIVSRALEGVLGVEALGGGAGQDKIGLELFAAGYSGPLMEFSCAATTVSLRGSVIAPLKANKMSRALALKFKAKKGHQKPEAFVGEAPAVLEASFGGGAYEQAGLTVAATQTSEEALEVDAAV